MILGASCARNLRARIPWAKVPTAENLCAENPSSILSPPLKYTYTYVQVKTDFRDLKIQNLKNGKSDPKNLNTLHILNSILYNFYFMQIYHIFTFEGLKLQKTSFGRSSARADPNPNHAS